MRSELKQHPADVALIERGLAEQAERRRLAIEQQANGRAGPPPLAQQDDLAPIVIAELLAERPATKDGKLRVYPKRHRFAEWMFRQLTTPRRTIRLLSWPFAIWPRAWSFLRAIAGGRVPEDVSLARLAECRACPFRIVLVRERHGRITESEFCEACKCGTHRLARLPFKARLRKWHCPKRRWKEAYPDDGVRAYLKESGHVTESQLGALSGVGCSGCGGNSQSKTGTTNL